MKQNKKVAEAAKKQAAIAGAVAERQMQSVLLRLSLLCMVILPLIICYGLRMFAAYIDTDLIYLYGSPLLSALSVVLYYTVLIGTVLFQYAGYGILGYSVLRYGVRASLAPVFLVLASSTLVYFSSIAETVYLYGASYIASSLSYLLPYWLINFSLAIFSELCIIFLCAMIRAAFARHGRLRIGIAKEDKEARRKNVLRRLYLYIVLLLLVFSLLSVGMDIFAMVSESGAPETFDDWVFLLEPIVETLLFAALGYFAASVVGAMLTKKNLAVVQGMKK